MIVTLLLILLFTKHFLLDYVWQSQWMINDKGIYGAPGGLAHSSAHGLGTFICLVIFVSVPMALFMALIDAFVHYHIDYAKSTWMQRNNPSVNNSVYWRVHGLDQYAHHITYLLIVAFLLFIYN
jgi:hypothetical protein